MSYTDIETRTQLVMFVVWSGDSATGARDCDRQRMVNFYEDVDDAIAYVDEMTETKGGDWDRVVRPVVDMPLLRRNGTKWMTVTRREIVRSSRRVT